ncbi:hypothetical protein ACVLD2_004692 [Paenibacillus sp. PvR052]|nr:hypothetical protein [Paenibacillus sp. PvP091]MBP1171143.1 hypothetical protein [Paenibacillus sp. PvR098]MBP2442171.1 hypothetical protein [Paenibacillus sp. PvP052]
MGRRNRRGIMSDEFKYELAKDLGFYETVQREGWGGIRTKDAGNMVKRAIQIAEGTLQRQNPVQVQTHVAASGQGMLPVRGMLPAQSNVSLATRYGAAQAAAPTPMYSTYYKQ